jgi:hypothetical protein
MVFLLQLVRKYELWLYGLCSLVFVFYVSRAWQARREWAAAFFALEREVAGSHLLRAVSGALFCCLVAGGIYYVSGYLATELQIPEVLGAEPTPILIPTSIPTPTPGPPPPTLFPTSTRQIVRTAQPTSTPAVTPMPRVIPPSCPDPSAQLTVPGINQVVQNLVHVQGTAQIQDFDYYKFEFRAARSGAEWAFLQRHDQPMAGEMLGTWDVSMLPNGEYEFRLVVVRRDGNYKVCGTRVTIQH